MPKFRVICEVSTKHVVTVEAPDITSVRSWYVRADGSEFSDCEEGVWRLVDMYKLPSHDVMTPAVSIDSSGKGETIDDESKKE